MVDLAQVANEFTVIPVEYAGGSFLSDVPEEDGVSVRGHPRVTQLQIIDFVS